MEIYWPIFLVVISNLFYHISAKGVPDNIEPFASLSVSYLVGAVFSLALFFITGRTSIMQEYAKLNWASIILGFAIVGLEAGFIYCYRIGWNISTAQVIASSILAIVLIVVGYFVYHERINMNTLIGVAICMFGLYIINR